ncbi:MAG TPA: Fic family protein [Methanocorpusculum sp.]|nr:Fic family protein [Methanocorpusculum sp.]
MTNNMTFDPETPYNALPHLPPATEVETPEIWKKCISANIALAKLKEATKLIPNPDILISTIQLLEANASSEIENIFTTTDSLYQALSIPSEKTDPATKEVLNYRKALYNGYQRLKDSNLLIDEQLLCHVCSILRSCEVTRRNCGVVIGNQKTIVYTPPADPHVIEALINNLIEYINKNEEPDPLICLALIHYQFESIHPFTDGNGRIGRILNILYLVKKGILDFPVLYLSRYIILHKSEYYTLLRKTTAENTFKEWICFMLDALKETAEETYQKINAITKLMNETREYCRTHLPPHMYSYELIETLFVQPYCKPAFLIDAEIGSRQTAMKYLKTLESLGILKSEIRGRERIYINTKLLEILN